MSAPRELYVDAARCIGCRSCEAACGECDDHAGHANVHLDVIDEAQAQHAPTVCMHCGTCAWVCPADAIEVDADGIVHTATASRCVACGNCAVACPFGVPHVKIGGAPMRKCDLCFGRTSEGLAPLCASSCPSGALFYGTEEELLRARPQRHVIRSFRFNDERVPTRNGYAVAPSVLELVLATAPAGDVEEPQETAEDVEESW